MGEEAKEIRQVLRSEFVRIAARVAAKAANWSADAACASSPLMAAGSPEIFIGEIRDLLSFLSPEAANGKRVI